MGMENGEWVEAEVNWISSRGDEQILMFISSDDRKKEHLLLSPNDDIVWKYAPKSVCHKWMDAVRLRC